MQKKTSFCFLFLFFFIGASLSSLHSETLYSEVFPCNGYTNSSCWLDIGKRFGGGRSYKRGYETIALIACWEKCFNAIADIEFHHIDNGELALNTGIGCQFPLNNFQHEIGVNVFYDFRRFSRGGLHQLGLGMELSGKCWDIIVNGYAPLGRKVLDDRTIFHYLGGFFAERKTYKTGMSGIDFELGNWIWQNRCLQFYAAAGAYYYHSHCCHDLVGGMARVYAEIGRFFSVELFATTDRCFHTKIQGEFTVLIPFSRIFCSHPCIWRPRPFQRNRIILAEKICCWKTNF